MDKQSPVLLSKAVYLYVLKYDESREGGKPECPQKNSKDLPNMNAFCDWFSETIVISVYDSFFGNYISIDLLALMKIRAYGSKALQ